MSGHSKWANIKHKKGKQDALKGAVYTKMAKLIAIAVKEGGGITDPASNARLKEAVTKAKASNMPNENIERAIKKGAGDSSMGNFEEITYEGYGIGGVAVIVEALTDNKNRTAGDVRYIFDKNGGNLGTSGCVSFLFEKQGVILIPAGGRLTEDEVIELALEAGADDVETSPEGFEITADPAVFTQVLDAVEKSGLPITEAQVGMSPKSETALTDPEQLKRFYKMLDMFEENEDVQEVYHNAALPEEE